MTGADVPAIEVDLNQVDVPLRWEQVFGRHAPTEVEIGSGKGRFLLGRLTRIPGVTGVHSSFELRRVVQRTELPLDHISDQTVL